MYICEQVDEILYDNKHFKHEFIELRCLGT